MTDVSQMVDFEKWLSASERAAREAVIRANDRFAQAMGKAIRKGSEKAIPGTVVETTPSIYAKRYQGELAISPCGSPAAMCEEARVNSSGAQAMK